MTKERRTVTLSKELDEVIAFLASGKQMNLSEFLETRLRMLPEIQKQIERFQNLPEDPIINIKKIEKKMGRKIPSRLSPKSSQKQARNLILSHK
jgi:hypothetical protein